MVKHLMAVAFVVGLALMLPACGNSAGTAGFGTIAVNAVSGHLSPTGGLVTLTGGDFSNAVGARAKVRLEATGGLTPFASGSSATAEVWGTITSPTTIDVTTPEAVVCGVDHIDLFVAVILESGVYGRSRNAIATLDAPTLTGFWGGSIFQAAVPSTWTLTGTGFGPVGGPVTVHWTSPTSIFSTGTSTTVVTLGTILDATTITGTSPEAAVCGTAFAAAEVDHVSFPNGSCTPPDTHVACSFLAPTLTSVANTQAGSPWVTLSTFAAAVPETFELTGTGFGPVGSVAQVRWRTPGVSSFQGGTSESTVVLGVVVSTTTIAGTSPEAQVCGGTVAEDVEMVVTLAGGSCSLPLDPAADLRAPTIAAI
jgi:hypothetical protein